MENQGEFTKSSLHCCDPCTKRRTQCSVLLFASLQAICSTPYGRRGGQGCTSRTKVGVSSARQFIGDLLLPISQGTTGLRRALTKGQPPRPEFLLIYGRSTSARVQRATRSRNASELRVERIHPSGRWASRAKWEKSLTLGQRLNLESEVSSVPAFRRVNDLIPSRGLG